MAQDMNRLIHYREIIYQQEGLAQAYSRDYPPISINASPHSSSLVSSSPSQLGTTAAALTTQQIKRSKRTSKNQIQICPRPKPKAQVCRIPPNASCKLHTVKEDDKGDVWWSVSTCAFCMLEICFVYGGMWQDGRKAIGPPSVVASR
jgi:hypothetical protein